MPECLRPGCSLPVPQSLLACRRDWLTLPPRLRSDINAAYRLHDREAHRDLMLAAVKEWQAQESESS